MYDVIIIGKGPAGISGALYTVRAGLKTLIISNGWGSLEKAEKIQNYYGLQTAVSGMELLTAGVEQAKNLGVDFVDDEVVGLNGFDGVEIVGLKDNYKGNSLILCMGSPKKKLPFVNLDKFEGNGISYCGICDGFFYRDKKIAVIGYNEYMVHEAVELKDISSDLSVLTNGRALDLNEDGKKAISGLKVDEEKITGFYGEDYLLGVEFSSGRKEDFDGVFIAYGSASGMEMAMKTGLLTENGAVSTDEKQCTNLPNIFAAGDCTGGFKQIAVAVGEGAVAAKSTIEYVRLLK